MQLHSMEPCLLVFPHINPTTPTYIACQGALNVDTMECSIHMMHRPPSDITLHVELVWGDPKNVSISSHWDCAGSWPFSWEARTSLSCIVNAMAADDLVTWRSQGISSHGFHPFLMASSSLSTWKINLVELAYTCLPRVSLWLTPRNAPYQWSQAPQAGI